ncbi:hypothetical protein OMAG_002387 [Candidatus Omnitrophus magneticus]|uniref:Uncharacterized protein n=1 Tax=Candidatus Omnitrophus magneticus TaxID=1609969 RepID=A0A0F0CKA4_9BACT|nr:hypothetical protein OMAG_002387 [Candidatus Omnitrophus magneticus]
MGISFAKSIIFFICIIFLGLMLLPSYREAGKLLIESGNYEGASFYLSKQFHRDPADIKNTKRYLESLIYLEKFDVMEKISEKLTHFHEKDIDMLKALASYYNMKMDMGKAAFYWEKILRVNPKDKEIKEKLIAYYVINKKHDNLINFYKREIKRDTAILSEYYSLGNIFLGRKNATAAISVWTALLDKFPNERLAVEKLAISYESAGDIEKSISLYRDIYSKYKVGNDYFLSFVEKLCRHNKMDEAIEMLEKLFYSGVRDKNIDGLLIELYQKSGRTKDALAILEECVEEYPEEYNFLKLAGELYLEQKDYTKAFTAIRSYNEKTGGDYHSHHIIGDLLCGMGDTRAGEFEYRKALELIRQ